jgi:hypothetical protein
LVGWLVVPYTCPCHSLTFVGPSAYLVDLLLAWTRPIPARLALICLRLCSGYLTCHHPSDLNEPSRQVYCSLAAALRIDSHRALPPLPAPTVRPPAAARDQRACGVNLCKRPHGITFSQRNRVKDLPNVSTRCWRLLHRHLYLVTHHPRRARVTDHTRTRTTLLAGLQDADPLRFAFRKTVWSKFGDSGMDNIELGG